LQTLVGRALDADPQCAVEASRALFNILAEGMADQFEPELCETYAEIFSAVIATAIPRMNRSELVQRYSRIKQPWRFDSDAPRIRNVFVLSRVTLGADVAVTSAVLDAVKKRFSEARVFLVGGPKSWGLFAADAQLEHLCISYNRAGTLMDRLAVWPELQAALSSPDSIVIDPDSRLTQLGLLPVCSEDRYYFFESRSYGGTGDETLVALVRRWLAKTLDIPDATPYVAPADQVEPFEKNVVAISFGVGENFRKRIPDPFEENLLRALAQKKVTLLVDSGAGGEEAERAQRAIERSGVDRRRVRTWQGSFSAFAAMIARSALYVGYDSAGQHVAAAVGTPLVSIFAGYPSPRMFSRWRPSGSGPIEVVPIENADPQQALERTLEAVERLGVI